MREIKFRVWDGERMETDLVDTEIWLEKGKLVCNTYKPLVWMQFTGLTDSEGTEIYEGDVLGEEGQYRVEWIGADDILYPNGFLNTSHGIQCGWTLMTQIGVPLGYRLDSEYMRDKPLRVVGNIYELETA